MKTSHFLEYQAPIAETLSLDGSGLLCGSTTGTASIDIFEIDDELSVEDYF